MSDDHGDLADISRRSEDVEAYYDDWADDYDGAIRGWGYSAPEDVARRLHALLPPPATLLDVGCGTGLSGQALTACGYSTIDGVDVSQQSLQRANATGVYRHTEAVDLQALPTSLPDDAYDGLVCVGVLTYVPDSTAVLDEFVRLVRPGGCAVLTHRTDLYREYGFGAALDALVAADRIEALEVSEPAPYLPGHPQFGTDIGIHHISFRVQPDRS